jgi:hypothetical protein
VPHLSVVTKLNLKKRKEKKRKEKKRKEKKRKEKKRKEKKRKFTISGENHILQSNPQKEFVHSC